jgi:aminomethyltransferase
MSVEQPLKILVLDGLHRAAGARFAPFAGWAMPTRYRAIKDEHMAVRTAAGLFDVSHMGEVFVRGKDALEAVNRLVTNDIQRIGNGRAQYTLMCYPDGGVVDDLIVYRLSDEEVLICVNASNRAKDVAWITEHITGDVVVTDESDDFVQLALQGPAAVGIGTALYPSLSPLGPFDIARFDDIAPGCLVARTGYTGEDGFEFYIPVGHAERIATALLEAGRAHALQWVGLAARDSLRLEARLPLYGHELSDAINPFEAGLSWVVRLQKDDFVGKDALATIKDAGPARRSRGLILEDRGMLREGYDVVVDGNVVGTTTSGSVAFAVGEPSVALALIDADHCNAERVGVSIRGKVLTARVTTAPFYKRSDA